MKSKAVSGVIKKFIQKKIVEAGRQGAVIGVSGGVDSAVCLYLCADAVGSENIYPLFMPSRNDPELSERVENLCRGPGVELKIYNLKDMVSAYLEMAGPATKMQEGNFTARLRTAFLYSEAESTGSLVINTSNLSETLVGYFTKWGDEAGDISPLGELYKTEVYELARYLKIPREIIEAEPTAGFFSGQTDEGELGMGYEKLDGILKAIQTGRPSEYKEEDVKKVQALISDSAHKRGEIPVPDIDRK